jgi:hypothetical protein
MRQRRPPPANRDPGQEPRKSLVTRWRLWPIDSLSAARTRGPTPRPAARSLDVSWKSDAPRQDGRGGFHASLPAPWDGADVGTKWGRRIAALPKRAQCGKKAWHVLRLQAKGGAVGECAASDGTGGNADVLHLGAAPHLMPCRGVAGGCASRVRGRWTERGALCESIMRKLVLLLRQSPAVGSLLSSEQGWLCLVVSRSGMGLPRWTA